MPFSSPSVVVKGQLGWDTATPVTKAYEFLLPFGLQEHIQRVYPPGIRGTLDQQAETLVQTINKIEGPVKFAPTTTLLSTILLQAIQGGTPTGSGTMTYPVSDANFDSYITIDRVAKVQTYGKVWIDQATFESEAGGYLTCDLDFFGQTLTEGAAHSFPTGLTPPAEPAFKMTGGTITVNSVAREVERVRWQISNGYLKERFFMSATLGETAKTQRTYDVTLTVPYNADNTDLEELAPTVACSGEFAWTDGTKTLTFNAGVLQLAETPVKRADNVTGEFFLDCHFNARRLSTADALSITL